MPKRSHKPRDLNALAANIVSDATDERAPEPESPQQRAGRAGGQKGGKARAERLSAQERSEAARKAARTRWNQAR